MLKQKIDSISTQYFTAFAYVRQITATTWSCSGELMRNDTSEMLPRSVIARGNNEESALAAIILELENEISNLGIPSDWENPDKVRQILWRYLEFWDEENRVVNSIKENGENFNLALASEIKLLNNKDQARLLTASDYTYNNPVRDVVNLNEIDARSNLFKLIDNPGLKVMQAYERHKKRLSDNWKKEKERIRLDSISTKYFTAFVSAICVWPNSWVATGELMRKDTSEMCPRKLEVKGDSEKTALDAVTQKMKHVLIIGEAPSDWETPDKLRQFLWRYIEFQRVPKGGLRPPSDNECEKVTDGFASELNVFSEEDQIRLFTEMGNNCSIDEDAGFEESFFKSYEFYARMELFKLIENPDEKVKQAYKKHMLHLKDVRERIKGKAKIGG